MLETLLPSPSGRSFYGQKSRKDITRIPVNRDHLKCIQTFFSELWRQLNSVTTCLPPSKLNSINFLSRCLAREVFVATHEVIKRRSMTSTSTYELPFKFSLGSQWENVVGNFITRILRQSFMVRGREYILQRFL